MKNAVLIAILAAATTTTAAAAGKESFATKCKACHGAEGQGNPGMAKMLKVELRHLGSKDVQAKTDAALKQTIVQGGGKMKPVAGLSAAQVDELVTFLRTLKQ